MCSLIVYYPMSDPPQAPRSILSKKTSLDLDAVFQYTSSNKDYTTREVVTRHEYFDERATPTMADNNFKRLFHPRSVTVIGVSHDLSKGATAFLHALIKMGFSGPIYPVHPHLSEIMGLKTYTRVIDIPHPVDYAIIGVPASSVPEVIKDCADKGVRFAQIFTSGFHEVGTRQGAELQRKIVDVARGKVRILGPNCMGVYYPKARFGFDADHPVQAGNVSFISQSGGLAINFIERGASECIWINKLVSIGNACDLKVTDFLADFSTDPETRVVGIYLEGLRMGEERRLFNLIKQMAPIKPLVMWKAGHTEAGARAAMSHTGSMVGSFEMWKFIIRQTGGILVNNMDEMVDVISMYLRAPLPEGKSVGIVAFGGGTSVTTADACTSLGLLVPPLKEDVQDSILKYVPEEGTFQSNPVDLTGWILSPRISRDVNLLVGNDSRIDALIYIFDIDFIVKRCQLLGLNTERLIKGHTKSMLDVKKGFRKPFLVILQKTKDDLEVERVRLQIRTELNRIGVPNFPNIERAAKALSKLDEYSRYLSRVKS